MAISNRAEVIAFIGAGLKHASRDVVIVVEEDGRDVEQMVESFLITIVEDRRQVIDILVSIIMNIIMLGRKYRLAKNHGLFHRDKSA